MTFLHRLLDRFQMSNFIHYEIALPLLLSFALNIFKTLFVWKDVRKNQEANPVV